MKLKQIAAYFNTHLNAKEGTDDMQNVLVDQSPDEDELFIGSIFRYDLKSEQNKTRLSVTRKRKVHLENYMD